MLRIFQIVVFVQDFVEVGEKILTSEQVLYEVDLLLSSEILLGKQSPYIIKDAGQRFHPIWVLALLGPLNRWQYVWSPEWRTTILIPTVIRKGLLMKPKSAFPYSGKHWALQDFGCAEHLKTRVVIHTQRKKGNLKLKYVPYSSDSALNSVGESTNRSRTLLAILITATTSPTPIPKLILVAWLKMIVSGGVYGSMSIQWGWENSMTGLKLITLLTLLMTYSGYLIRLDRLPIHKDLSLPLMEFGLLNTNKGRAVA